MKIINIDDKYYPEKLKLINNPPNTIYVEGNIDILNNKAITVVGSRNMSEYGKNITNQIVKDLVKYNLNIVSGLALGIDSVAHNSCLENKGKTIAVIAGGFNHIFPPENIELYNRIINSGGCIISEHPPDVIPKKVFFPMRNRIVSGLTDATLVIEATYRSGTSITAGYAFKQGKKVFCIPNGIGNKNSVGIFNLIKKGAQLITSAEEILQELNVLEKVNTIEEQYNNKEKLVLKEENEELNKLDDITKQVYFCIKENGIINSELISNILNINIQEINVQLSILELNDIIESKDNNNFSIKEKFIF